MRGLRPLPAAADYGRAAWWRTDDELRAIAGPDCPDFGAMSDTELEAFVGGAPARGGVRDSDSPPRAAGA